MWEPRWITSLWGSKNCYKDSFTFNLSFEARCYKLRTFSGKSHVVNLPVVCHHWPTDFIQIYWNCVLCALQISSTCQDVPILMQLLKNNLTLSSLSIVHFTTSNRISWRYTLILFSGLQVKCFRRLSVNHAKTCCWLSHCALHHHNRFQYD
jgi:hypothetical protein